MLYTDRRVTSCIHYVSTVLEERTGLRLPVPNLKSDCTRDEAAAYRQQLVDNNIKLTPIDKLEDNAVVLFQNYNGFHLGISIYELDNMIAHGDTGKLSRANSLATMKRFYKVKGMYRVEEGKPDEIDKDFVHAQGIDPISLPLLAIISLGAGILIKRYIDRQFKDLPDRSTENVYNLVGGRNQTRPDQPLPICMGRMRFYPDFSIPPYNRYEGLNQLWRAGLNFGVGRLRMDQLRLGDTDFLQFLAFGSSNSFDVVGGVGERPPYWEDNVGGARSRTQEFSVFQESDIRGPGVVITGGPSEIRSSGEVFNAGTGFAGLTDVPDFVIDTRQAEVITDTLSTLVNSGLFLGDAINFLNQGLVLSPEQEQLLNAAIGRATEEIFGEGGDGGSSGEGQGGQDGGGPGGNDRGGDPGREGPGAGGGGGDR